MEMANAQHSVYIYNSATSCGDTSWVQGYSRIFGVQQPGWSFKATLLSQTCVSAQKVWCRRLCPPNSSDVELSVASQETRFTPCLLFPDRWLFLYPLSNPWFSRLPPSSLILQIWLSVLPPAGSRSHL